MPHLIKNIEGEVLNNFVGNTSSLSIIVGKIGLEDYIGLNNYIGYLQNFSRIEEVVGLTIPTSFGLTNNNEMVTLEISY